MKLRDIATFNHIFSDPFIKRSITDGLVFILITMLCLGGIYIFLINNEKKVANNAINGELDRLQNVFDAQGINMVIEDINQLNIEYTLSDFYYILTDRAGKKISGDLNSWPKNLKPNEPIKEFIQIRSRKYPPQTEVIRFFGRGIALSDNHQLLIARSHGLFSIYTAVYIEFLTFAFTVLTILTIMYSFYIVREQNLRMRKYNQSIDRIIRGDLSERFAEVQSSPLESVELSRNLNRMLDVISLLMDDVRRVSDNIAHDLRTPLTRLRNNLTDLREQSSKIETADMQSLIDETDHILSTFNSLLRIAKIEAGHVGSSMSRFRLSELIQDVIELYEPLASDSAIELQAHLNDKAKVIGEPHLLFQVLANLLDNAIKFSLAGGKISVSIINQFDNNGVAALELPEHSSNPDSDNKDINPENYIGIKISDTGTGVSSNNYKKLFRRFYREEQSRGIKPGSGLGLSMVYAVMQIHQGAIYVADNNPGFCITLVLKKH